MNMIDLIDSFDLLILFVFVIVCSLAFGVTLIVKARRKTRIQPLHEALKLVFSLYIVLLLLLTLRPGLGFGPIYQGARSVNITPFSTILQYVRFARDGSANQTAVSTNLLGNILAFLPMGLLLPVVWPRFGRLWKAVLFGMLFSVGIELSQLLFTNLGVMSRMTDIDDVILNTAGALTGYGVFALGRLLSHVVYHRDLPAG
jgi:glycopeptide antibiotics resistance protein